MNDILPAVTVEKSNDVTEATTITPSSGVIVNFTMQVSKSVSSSLLEQELTRALQLTHMKIGDSALLAAPLSQSVHGNYHYVRNLVLEKLKYFSLS